MEACGATDRTTGDGARVDHESKRVNCSRVIMRKLQEERVRDAKYHIISKPPPPVEVTRRNQEADIVMRSWKPIDLSLWSSPCDAHARGTTTHDRIGPIYR